jgi:type IV pilus assembly protein PilZ
MSNIKPAAPVQRQGILSVSFPDKPSLYAAYMPHVKNGGLFIPTTKSYHLGDEVFILLSLMGETEKLPIAGRVAWITPKGAQGNRVAGIGVQFGNLDGGAARNKIEGHLAGMLQAERDTHTM